MDVSNLPEDFLEQNPLQDTCQENEEGQLKESQPIEGEEQPPGEEPVEKEEEQKPAKRGKKSSQEEPDKKKPKKDTPKSEKKSRRKAEKPQFVKGVPISPIQGDSPAPNPYNFDPMAEVMKLGTGQLQSAYRKSRTNVAPPKEKKIYKLEHKEEGDSIELDQSVEEECPPERTVERRSSFMPDFSSLLPPISMSTSAPATPIASGNKMPSSSIPNTPTLLEIAAKIKREAKKLNKLNRI